MIILTMLGTTPYTPTTYVWEQRRCDTLLFVAALATWFPDAHIKVFVTAEAQEKNGALLQGHVPHAELIPISSGQTEAEQWDLFNTLAASVPDGEEVIFDITHGFRSLPVLALLAVGLLRVAKGVELKHLLYGAWERNKTETPVFDLTPFVAMLDWATATERFLETGDARKFKKLLEGPLEPLGMVLHGLSEGVAFLRTTQVATEAARLPEAIRAAKTEMGPSHAPLGLLLERIEKSFTPLGDDKQAGGTESLQAQWAQINWLVENGHFSSAAGLAREWLVSLHLWSRGKKIYPVTNTQRTKSEEWLNGSDNDNFKESKDPKQTKLYHATPEEWELAIDIWKKLSEFRNDLMHFGMRPTNKSPEEITNYVKSLPKSLTEAVKPLGLEVGV